MHMTSGLSCTQLDVAYTQNVRKYWDGIREGHWTVVKNNRKPKDIAPHIFVASVRKKWKIKEALSDDAWVSKVKLSENFTLEHIRQFVALWTIIHDFQLDTHAEDEIVWKNTNDGQYSAASAY